MGDPITAGKDEHNERRSNKAVWHSLALYGFSSLNLAIMTAGGYYLGKLLEESFHWSNLRITGVLLGLFLGMYEMFVIALKAGSKK